MLTHVTGRVDCFGCVCAHQIQRQSALCFICVLIFMYYTMCYFTGLFYAVVRQISMLFVDNKDSVCWQKKCALNAKGLY